MVGKTSHCLVSLWCHVDGQTLALGYHLGVSRNKNNGTNGKGRLYTSCAVKYYPTHKWYDETNVWEVVV